MAFDTGPVECRYPDRKMIHDPASPSVIAGRSAALPRTAAGCDHLVGAHGQGRVKRAFSLGALGFIPKTTEREVMLNAIQLVLSGGIYIPSEILD
jgi:hypothetical protein